MQQVIARWVDRIRDEYDDAVAILLKGSHARGEAAAWSDIDFDVLVNTADTEDYRTWIERAGDRLVHISAAIESVDGWIRDADEPSSWSYGLPTQESTRLMWTDDTVLRQQLDRPFKAHPAASPEVEDTMEALGKVRNAIRRGDDLAVYQAAQVAAKLIPTFLVPINPPVVVTHARAAIDAICGFPNAPEGFAEDWLVCAGFTPARTAVSIAHAAENMIRRVIGMVPIDADLVGEDIANLLERGVIQAYIAQEDER